MIKQYACDKETAEDEEQVYAAIADCERGRDRMPNAAVRKFAGESIECDDDDSKAANTIELRNVLACRPEDWRCLIRLAGSHSVPRIVIAGEV